MGVRVIVSLGEGLSVAWGIIYLHIVSSEVLQGEYIYHFGAKCTDSRIEFTPTTPIYVKQLNHGQT